MSKSGRSRRRINSRRRRSRNTFVYEYWEWKCAYCGVEITAGDANKVTDKTATIDHIVPISMGGENTLENIVACCRKCNFVKDNDHPDDAFL
jgi:5-methylcytosine-specific restriction endonuclease McrA